MVNLTILEWLVSLTIISTALSALAIQLSPTPFMGTCAVPAAPPACKSDPAGLGSGPFQRRRPLRGCCSMKTGHKVVSCGLVKWLVKK